jgi:hypothetical protein
VLQAAIDAHPGTTCAHTPPIAGAALVIFNVGFWKRLNQAINQAIMFVNLIPSLVRELSRAEATIPTCYLFSLCYVMNEFSGDFLVKIFKP